MLNHIVIIDALVTYRYQNQRLVSMLVQQVQRQLISDPFFAFIRSMTIKNHLPGTFHLTIFLNAH